jgi:hypothetical protein
MLFVIIIVVLMAGCADLVGLKSCNFMIKEYNYITDLFEDKWVSSGGRVELSKKQSEDLILKTQKTEIVDLVCE